MLEESALHFFEEFFGSSQTAASILIIKLDDKNSVLDTSDLVDMILLAHLDFFLS